MGHRDDAEQRTLKHARRGYALALSDPAYLGTVRERLAPALEAEPSDLWQSIDWTWAVMPGHGPPQGPPQGPLSRAIARGSSVLRELLAGDDTALERWAAATGDRLSLHSTLSSHPFADQASWLLRKTSLAS
jgi:hypothetical protein